MLRGLVGEELEDLADLGVVIWLLGTPFTEECSKKREGDIEKREKKMVLLLTLIFCYTCIAYDLISLFEDDVTYIK